MLHPRGNRLRFRGVIFCSMLLLWMLFILSFPVQSRANATDACDPLLGLKFNDTLPSEEQKYLGIARKKPFSLKDIQGTVFVVEVFSTYCTTCPRDVPVVNTAYASVRNDPGLKENVRVFSIAIGNNRTEADQYKKEHKIPYPVLTDYDFIAHKALGNPRVPYTLILRKTAQGRCIFEYSHQGVLSSADEILKILKSCTL